VVRPSKEALVVYKFVDALGMGFGISFFLNGSLYYSSGQWNHDHSSEPSNFRELANLIFSMEEAKKNRLLENSDVFVFMDNSMAYASIF
jgi:hypothetical protein